MRILRAVGAGARWALVMEWRMYVGVWRLLARRHDVPPGATAVPYVGGVAVLLWAFTLLSVVELGVLHLILSWETVRLAADILGIWGVVWILGMTGCHYVYPHLLTGAALRVRNAERRDLVTVPWDLVDSVSVRERSTESSRSPTVTEEQGRPVLHVAIASRTNVDVRLSRPVPVVVRRATHQVREVRLFADDPRALAAAVWAQAGRGAGRPS